METDDSIFKYQDEFDKWFSQKYQEMLDELGDPEEGKRWEVLEFEEDPEDPYTFTFHWEQVDK